MSVKDFQSQFLPVADKSMETAVAAGRIILTMAEEFRVLYFSLVRESMGDVLKSTQILLTAQSPQDLASVQSSITQFGSSKLISAPQSSLEISMKAATELGSLWSAQFSELNTAVTDLVPKIVALQQNLEPKTHR